MTGTPILPTTALPDDLTTAALPGAADSAASAPAGDEAAIDPRAVARLAMYLREGLYLVDLADGSQRQVARDDWHELVHRVVSQPDSRLSPVTAGRYDVIWRVDWTAREED